LRANEKFLENVFDGIQDGISILDKNLNIVKTNKWIEKMYSSKTPLVGKKCYEIYQKRKETCPWCPSVKAMKTGEMQTEVVPYPSKEKPSGWMLLSAYPLEDESGIVTGVIEYVKNITDRVKAEEDIKKTLKELQEYKELTVGRENQMIELKKKVNELSKELGRAEPFDIAFAE
jgi:PAS domain S-box-containing protein